MATGIAAAREGYKPATGTVRIWLDSEVTKRRAQIITKINEAAEKGRGRVTAVPEVKALRDELAKVEAEERNTAHLLEFTKLPGIEWSNLSDAFPPILNDPFDDQLGYGHKATSLAAARLNATKVMSGDPEDKDGPREPLSDEDWDTILEVGAGFDIGNIVDVVMQLNVVHASNKLGRLVKG